MAVIDTSIPARVYQNRGNALAALSQGMEIRDRLDQRQQRNALASLAKQQGPGLVAGDEGAINALARLSPEMAAGYQDRAMQAQAAKRAAALEKAGMVAGAIYSADTPEKFDAAKGALMDAGIIPPEDAGRYSFEGREALIAQAQGVEGQIKQENDLLAFEEGKRQFGVEMAQKAREFGQRHALDRARVAMQQDQFNREFNYKRERDAQADMAAAAELAQPARGPKPPSGFTYQEDGSLAFIPGGPADPAYKQQTRGNGITQTLPDGTVIQIGGQPKLTEGQAKDVGFVQRMNEAESQMQAILADGYDPTSPSGFGDKMLSRSEWSNFLSSPDGQAFQNAVNNFLVAVLRKDTGAAVTETEWKVYAPLFTPQFGDSPRVLEQKRRQRELAIDATSRNVPLADIVARIRGDAGNRTRRRGPRRVATEAEPRNADIQALSDADLMRALQNE